MQASYIPEWNFGIEVLPIEVPHLDEMSQFMTNLRKTEADVLINIFQSDGGEHGMFSKIFPRTIWYTPVESKGMSLNAVNDIRTMFKNGGIPVAQCKYAQKEMKFAGINTICIYHGYNDKVFKPIDLKNGNNNDKDIKYCYYKTDFGKEVTNPELLIEYGCHSCQVKDVSSCSYFKEEIVNIMKFVDIEKGKQKGKRKERTWSESEILISNLTNEFKNKFVYLFIGQNFRVRKRIERLLHAYYLMIKDNRELRDRTCLHLHTMPMSIVGLNLAGIAQSLGIQDNVSFSYGGYRSSGWSEEAMNILYNIADCHVSASSGEGFGMSTLETMACGIPTVGPRNSSFIELIEEKVDINGNTIGPRGMLADGDYQMIQDGTYRFLVDEKDLAEKMKFIYDGKDYSNYRQNCLEFSKQYTWDNIVKQWDELIKSLK